MLARVAVVPETAPGVPGISKRVGGAAEQVPLQLRTLLRVKVFRGEEVSKRRVI